MFRLGAYTQATRIFVVTEGRGKNVFRRIFKEPLKDLNPTSGIFSDTDDGHPKTCYCWKAPRIYDLLVWGSHRKMVQGLCSPEGSCIMQSWGDRVPTSYGTTFWNQSAFLDIISLLIFGG